jgi:GH18 family chitinase
MHSNPGPVSAAIPVLATILAAAAVHAAGGAPNKSADRPAPPFHVVGYLPDYRLASFDPAAAKYLTDVVYFSAEADPSGELRADRLKPEAIKTLQKIKEQHGVSLLLCVGGWERSKGFAPLAASPRGRERFVGSVTRFCLGNQFDGADLDWEHLANDEEVQNYGALLVALKKGFEPHKLRLTVALAGWQTLPADAVQALDRVHLMAYDARGRHATLDFAESELARQVKNGIPAAKLCLGVPFYGRALDNPAKSVTYAELVHKYGPAAEVDEVDGIYFNGVKTIERKAGLAREKKLAGIMAWELGQDTQDEHSLLRAIHRVLNAAPDDNERRP